MSVSQPMFHIITRTCNRPVYFEQCQTSILSQTYPADNINKYVTFDDEKDLDTYIQKYVNLVIIETEREKRKNQTHFPYHNYLNEVINYMTAEKKTGWIMILDDDNMLSKKTSLEILSKYIMDGGNDPGKFYIWKCQQGETIVPSDINFGKSVKNGDLHISCFAFHSSQANLVTFAPKKSAESDVVATLFNKLKCVWINDTLTKADVSGNGTRKDLVIPQETKKKITLKSSICQTPIQPSNPQPVKPSITIRDPPTTQTSHTKIKERTEQLKKISTPIEINRIDDDDDEIDDEIDDMDEEMNDDEIIDDLDEEVVSKSVRFENINSDEEEIVDIVEPVGSDEEIITDHKHKPQEHPISEKDKEKKLVQEKPTKIPNKNQQNQPTNPKISSLPPQTKSDTLDVNKEILNKLINLLSSGQKIYILDENNMKHISKCICESYNCMELENKLIQILETRSIENKTNEIKNKLNKGRHDKSNEVKKETVDLPLNKSTVEKNSGDSFVDKVYVLTDDNNIKNTTLERNKKILANCKFDYELITCKEMSLYLYQNQIKDLLTQAKKNNYHRIMILNGNDLLNTKFAGLYERQVNKINDDCYLWFLGLTKDTSPKDIVNTKFELEDYLFMYDDIVTAKFTTAEKARTHWKTYGHREARYAAIEPINNPQQHIINNYGFVISEEVYDDAITIIDKQNNRDCKNFLIELQKNHVDMKKIWFSRPDLIIPGFTNPSNSGKNGQIAIKNGWYYNFYK